MIWLNHPHFLTPEQARPLGEMIYPINITQACITTGLITFKIWRQHIRSRAAGLSAQSGVGLSTIVRIIVESTMISTVQQVIVGVLFYMDNAALWVFHGSLVPSMGTCSVQSLRTMISNIRVVIGIAFALLSIRVHGAWRTSDLNIRIPQSSSRRTTFALTPSIGAGDRDSNHRNRCRNHLRTLSDGALHPPFGVSTRERRSGTMARMGGAVDLGRGDSGIEKSNLDASLAMKRSGDALE